MPFTRPTITQLINRAKADIETRLPGADARVRRTVEAVLARMESGGVHGMHGHLVWLSRQIMADTAEVEFMERWADIWGIQRDPAVSASGTLTITGTNTTVCPAATVWQDAEGTLYDQDDDVTISGGSASATVTAQVGGADGNQDVGATLSLVTPISGVDADATVGGIGLTGGVDLESDESLREELLHRLQNPPKGGGPEDYVTWSLEVSGVTRAWQYPNLDGLGTVGVFFVMDDKVGTIIPDSSEVATLQAYLDTVAPVTADVTVYAPVAVELNITAQLNPNTTVVQTAVEAELASYLLRVAEPGATLLWSQISEAISLAPGEINHVLTVPATDKTHTTLQIPVDGTSNTWSPIP